MIIKDITGDELEISLRTNVDGTKRLWICNTETDVDGYSVGTLFNPSDIDTIIEALQEIKERVG